MRNVSCLVEILAVGRDDLLVPVEALLAAAREVALARIVLVHIDEAVAFVHLARGGRDDVVGLGLEDR